MDDPTAKWRNRATILAEFTGLPPRQSYGEDLTIEWSSSDEEPRHPPTSDNKEQHSENSKLQIPIASYQNSSSGNEEGQISPQESDEEKALLNTSYGLDKKHNSQALQSFLPLSKHHDISEKENKMDIRENESYLLASGRSEAAASYTSASGIDLLEPQSPILGSGKIVAQSYSPILKGKKMQIKDSLSLFSSRKLPKRKMTACDDTSLKRQMNNDDVSVNLRLNAATRVRKEEHRNINSYHGHCVSYDSLNSSTKRGTMEDIHEAELDKCSSQPRLSQDIVSQSPEKIYSLHLTPKVYRGEHVPSDSSLKEIIEFGSYGSQDNCKKDFDSKPSVWSDLSIPQQHLRLDGEDSASQSIAVSSEGTNGHLDIEASPTPHKNSANITEDSESSVLQADSTTDLLMLDSNARSGFDWVKHLQTPQKLLNTKNNEDGLESTKKKLIKDGQAEHLKHMLMSWRSSITVWNHKLSLTTLLGISPRQSPSLPSEVQHQQSSTSGVVKLESQAIKAVCSTPVKNLNDFLIENPASSVETPKVSQKYLNLRLIDVGGQLPNNAALCEAIGSNVEEFQTSLKIKNENGEAAETRIVKKFLVFFALEEHNITNLCKSDTVRVYATWQNLSVSAHDIPALFTSYFKFHLKEEESTSFPMDCKRTILHTWTCSCSDEPTVIPLCGGEPRSFPWVSNSQASNTLLLGAHPRFTIIKDKSDTLPQNGKEGAGTILEALEKCGGVSGVPVSITIRIHRTIIQREPSGNVEVWELIGQDAAGQFCIVKIPNWPLAQELMEAFSDTAGSTSTHILTNLMMTQRLTNTQNPALFSLITSLHNAYQRMVSGDPLLQPILQDLYSCPPQTHCYVLTVSLGVTRVLSCGEQVTFPIKLPHWSLQETLEISDDGQRGSLTVYVLYKTRSNLHIVNTSHQEGSPSMLAVGKKTEETKSEEILLISKVMLMGATLPHSWPESGPLMLSVVLKDAVLWHGSLVVDEYSFIEVQEEESQEINLALLNQRLSPLSSLTQQDSLTIVSGTIIKVEEENAFTYFICDNCKSDKVQEAGDDGQIDCLSCGHKSTILSRGYFMEVWLDCGPELQQTDVKVKLYQKTIKKLLQAYCGWEEEKYSAAYLLGHQMGPMACVLLQLQRPRHCSTCTYNLAELPY